jgi:hypothetical protein
MSLVLGSAVPLVEILDLRLCEYIGVATERRLRAATEKTWLAGIIARCWRVDVRAQSPQSDAGSVCCLTLPA